MSSHSNFHIMLLILCCSLSFSSMFYWERSKLAFVSLRTFSKSDNASTDFYRPADKAQGCLARVNLTVNSVTTSWNPYPIQYPSISLQLLGFQPPHFSVAWLLIKFTTLLLPVIWILPPIKCFTKCLILFSFLCFYLLPFLIDLTWGTTDPKLK